MSRLSSLPHSIGHLQSLRELHLKSNRLAVFPDSILRLKPHRFTGECLANVARANVIGHTAGENPLVSQESRILTGHALCSLVELSLRAVHQHSLFSCQIPYHLQSECSDSVNYYSYFHRTAESADSLFVV